MNAAETCSSAEFAVGLVDRSKVVKGAAAAGEVQDDAMPEPTDEQGRFTTAESTGSTNISSYSAPSPGRRRSMSLASGQPTLETVVVKAKRAASSLWILLHAQVRTDGLAAALPPLRSLLISAPASSSDNLTGYCCC
jgi:hypothetical protein